MSRRRDLLSTTHYQLTQRLRGQIQSLLGPQERELTQYTRRFQHGFKGTWEKATYKELIHHVSQAQIVLGADFHSHSQSQRTHLRLLRSLPRKTNLTLCLECFDLKDQKWIDLYLAGKLSQSRFLKEIKWEKKWGFRFEDYEPLIALAKKRKWRILGINKQGPKKSRNSLNARDKSIADKLHVETRNHPEAVFYVIIGEMHLAKAHLPKYLKAKGIKSLLLLHQNVDHLYFTHTLDQDLEDAVLKKSDGEFCILNSPPWLRWQSYLSWLEARLREEPAEPAEEADELLIQARKIVEDELKVKINLDQLSVFGPGELDLNQIQSAKTLSSAQMSVLKQHMIRGQAFVIPQLLVLYLGRLNMNHASELLGLWMHAESSRLTKLISEMPEDFEKLIWHRAVGFFVSKLVNPHRKVDSYEDLSALFERHELNLDILKICLTFQRNELMRMMAMKERPYYRPRLKSSYWIAAEKLGGILGQRLFSAYRNGDIQRKLLLKWLGTDVFGPEWQDVWEQIRAKVESVRVARKGETL